MDSNTSAYFDFHLILLGVDRWISDRANGNYRLPELMQWAAHRLHARQVQRGETPTVTHHQTLSYLSQEIELLFDPSSELPPNIEIDTFVQDDYHDDFELGDGIEDYLRQSRLVGINSINELINSEENAPVKTMKDRLDKRFQAIGLTDADRLQVESEYTEWRAFLTAHNIIQQTPQIMMNRQWQAIRDDGYYQPVRDLWTRVVHTNEEGEPVYLFSKSCGLLYKTASGTFQPLKWSPSFEGVEHAEQIPVGNNDFILKQTHQLRIFIPGQPELQLFEALNNYPEVVELRLFPGIDRYDLRVVWQDGTVDAIDVKTHRGPHALEKALRRKKPIRLDKHELNLLGYDRFFYLIPKDYINARGYPHGLTKLKTIANKRGNNVFVATIEEYLNEGNYV